MNNKRIISFLLAVGVVVSSISSVTFADVEEDVINAFPLINKLKRGETYVLLENDLPDIFK